MINISTDIPRKIQDGLGDSAIAMDDVCSEIKVTNKEEYIASAAILLKTKQMAKLISSEFSVQKSLADKAHKTICGSEKSFLTPLIKTEERVKSLMSSWKEYQDEEDLHNEAFISSVPVVDGIETREKWSCDVFDPLKIPREYLVVDEKRLNELARRTKGSVEVDGVRFNSTTTIVVRSKNEPINR